MKDGKIDLDSETGKELGFISDRFASGSYLWKQGGFVYVSFIQSKQEGKGFLRELFRKIQERGLSVKVPTPFPKMELICRTHGFQKTREWFEEAGEYCEVWVKS